MEVPFSHVDYYQTDAQQKRSFWDKISMGTSMYFGPKFLYLLTVSRNLALANKFDTATWASTSYDIFRLLEDCGGKFTIEGMDRISEVEGPVVFVSNHMSMLESMVFPSIIASRREVTFVVKKSLTTHALFGPTMRARSPIAVDRKDPVGDFKTVMAEGEEKLKNGTSIVIFPQSQRMVQFDEKQFNTLGIKLAKKANVPVIPVAIKTDFWTNGKWFKDIGRLDRSKSIHIKFGAPITVDGPGKKEHQEVIDFIQSHLEKWNHEA